MVRHQMTTNVVTGQTFEPRQRYFRRNYWLETREQRIAPRSRYTWGNNVVAVEPHIRSIHDQYVDVLPPGYGIKDTRKGRLPFKPISEFRPFPQTGKPFGKLRETPMVLDPVRDVGRYFRLLKMLRSGNLYGSIALDALDMAISLVSPNSDSAVSARKFWYPAGTSGSFCGIWWDQRTQRAIDVLPITHISAAWNCAIIPWSDTVPTDLEATSSGFELWSFPSPGTSNQYSGLVWTGNYQPFAPRARGPVTATDLAPIMRYLPTIWPWRKPHVPFAPEYNLPRSPLVWELYAAHAFPASSYV